MSKKLYAALLPLLAVSAFAMAPAVAQAEPHWYSCHEVAAGTGKYTDPGCTKKVAGNFELTRLPFTSAKTPFIISGTVSLKNASTGELGPCRVSGAGNVWNVNLANSGKDEVEVFTLYGC